MNKFCSLILLSLFATALNASSLSWDRTEARVELKPDEEEARATFIVTNNGEKAVRIARIKTSCGCTGSILERKLIEPGKTLEVIGTFHKGKRQGLNHNKLEVFLDNQPDSVATLHLIVQVPTLIEAHPKIIYWNKDSPKTERSIRLSIDKRYVDSITDIRYNKEMLTLSQEPDPSEKYELLVKVSPTSYEKMMRETIVIEANSKDGSTAEARLHIFVQP